MLPCIYPVRTINHKKKRISNTVPVFVDTLAGMLPAVIVDDSELLMGDHTLNDCPNSSSMLTVRLTRKVGAYHKGEILEYNTLRIVPRSKIIGEYKNRIAAYRLRDYYVKGEAQ